MVRDSEPAQPKCAVCGPLCRHLSFLQLAVERLRRRPDHHLSIPSLISLMLKPLEAPPPTICPLPFFIANACYPRHRLRTSRRRQWNRPVSGPRCARLPRRSPKLPQPRLSALLENANLEQYAGISPAAEPPRPAKKRVKSLFRNTLHISNLNSKTWLEFPLFSSQHRRC